MQSMRACICRAKFCQELSSLKTASRTAHHPSRHTIRHLHEASPQGQEEYIPQQPQHPQQAPRWQETPPRMKAPHRSRPGVPQPDFAINEDPAKLDAVYNSVLGDGGADMLSEETKWLAVTHKSFDQGRRGFNDRLSFLGRRIVALQTSLAMVHKPASNATQIIPDEHGREPFQHPALASLGNLTDESRTSILEKDQMASLARKYGLPSVVRWRPKRITRLEQSGLPLVIQQALFAIVGAVALQRGGQVANEITRTRILKPLGLIQE